MALIKPHRANGASGIYLCMIYSRKTADKPLWAVNVDREYQPVSAISEADLSLRPRFFSHSSRPCQHFSKPSTACAVYCCDGCIFLV